MATRLASLMVVCWLTWSAGGVLRADVFVTTSGGRVAGERVSAADDSSTLKVRTFGGIEVEFAAADVVDVVPHSDEQLEYERTRRATEDTPDGHWELAEWCREQGLDEERGAEMRRVLDLDPDHVGARHGLGYSLLNGKWVTRNEIMKQRGYVRHNGRWRTRQEIDRLDNQQKQRHAEGTWFKRVKKWGQELDGPKAAESHAAIVSITDPFALPALSRKLLDEKRHEPNPQYRYYFLQGLIHLVEAQGEVPDPAAIQVLVDVSLGDPNEELRHSALDYLADARPPEAVFKFIDRLDSANNALVNRAAIALGRMGHTASVGPLIEALVTRHKFQIGSGQAPMTATFDRPDSQGRITRPQQGTSGGGLSVGGGPKTLVRNLRNPEVRTALVELAGVDFEYQVDLWRRWYASLKKQPDTQIDARRN